ncbi:hypothetical protein GCM10011415_28310 [Salipiger pallidus]|uniref:Uncharacterized protein n=1 Tax=Salipiger pallidus TaxID=1775170 RepID=A0A8J2ZL16_9RHOB|nr:hypothetical protein [Salipiger pallidus]GGG77724.1 hypothetical protein GCM10011415_28310 [Salipiger pallidus]
MEDPRVIQLERELAATRNAAVRMMVGLVSGLISDSAAREEIAQSFIEDARGANEETQRLARLVAAELAKKD